MHFINVTIADRCTAQHSSSNNLYLDPLSTMPPGRYESKYSSSLASTTTPTIAPMQLSLAARATTTNTHNGKANGFLASLPPNHRAGVIFGMLLGLLIIVAVAFFTYKRVAKALRARRQKNGQAEGIPL